MMPPFGCVVWAITWRPTLRSLLSNSAMSRGPLTRDVIDFPPAHSDDLPEEEPMLTVAVAGTFAASLEPTLRARLNVPCNIVVTDERAIVGKLVDVDVLVTMSFTRGRGRAAGRLALGQVPGAGLDPTDRAALPAAPALANAYGHDVGIAEYVLGAMLPLTRDFLRLDPALRCGIWASQWAVGAPPP